ncbi:hypothetical protein LTR70_009613 [Exophiala xenobiotica]|uniref:Uncharacterized protein n=1 Tax=Lithohypha guttulata TaxID=1690604 RepID=A0ABR0JWX1_9EURO|nr:hypothetical protein LTR24_009515 [Lithohypha guttulata]KAK5310273.1 hypothetical protein LTR70_009613 [Exophiala xenobiotica]
MARHDSLAAISNPLINPKQLLAFQQQHQPQPEADTAIFKLSLLTQTAGVLLRLPQEVIATSIVVLQRYITASTTEIDSDLSLTRADFTPTSPLIQSSSASLYLTAKQSFYPLSPRSIINAYALLTSPSTSPLPLINPSAISLATSAAPPTPHAHFVTEGTYLARLATLFTTEQYILTTLSFSTTVTLPHPLALTYLQSLSATPPALASRTLSHLNAALLSPQLLYLTHQPPALAVAAIYLSARELGIPLVDDEVPWWEVFDVGREELGFLVLSLASLDGFVVALRENPAWI